MKPRGWVQRRLDRLYSANTDPNEDEMALRATQALDASIRASALSQSHAEEAQRLFGAIRREVKLTKVQKPKPS